MSAVFKFTTRQVHDEPKSLEMGVPHFKEEAIVIIKADERSSLTLRAEDWLAKLEKKVDGANPDNRDNAERELERAKRAYDRFADGKPEEIEGRPLAEWPRVRPAQIQTLNYLNILSVEDLAAASDTQVGKIHGGVRLRQEAQKYLEASKEGGASAMATRLTDLEGKLEAALRDNAELRKALDGEDEKPRPRRRKAAA